MREAPITTGERAHPNPVRIGDMRVGDGLRTLIIAEAGVNHDGSVGQALRLIDAAKDAGADLVKFQMFRAGELATASAASAQYQQIAGATSQRAMLARLELSDEEFVKLRTHAASRGVGFLVTPFGPRDVERLGRLHVPAIKLASTDLNNTPLLRRVVETGRPLIVSTGAATREEMESCVGRMREWGAGDRLVLLHCISGYPAPLEVANLRVLATMRNHFGVPCGFSDHTRSTRIGGWAVAAGACVLEKHFTLDRAAEGPDHTMSLDPGELATYVANVRAVETALGDGRIGMADIEHDVRTVARKSVVAAAQIPAGTIIAAEMLAVKRPAGGIEPDQFDDVVGRIAATDISPDTLLTWDLVR